MKTVFPKAFLALISAMAWGGPALYADSEATNTSALECSKELLLSYFPQPFVRETLKKNQIPEDKWDAIVQELSEKDKTVIAKVEARAGEMNPNPLKSPEYREQAITIFKETLLEIFTQVMNNNGITDNEQIHTMLDEVQHLKAKRFAKCLEQTRIELEKKS